MNTRQFNDAHPASPSHPKSGDVAEAMNAPILADKQGTPARPTRGLLDTARWFLYKVTHQKPWSFDNLVPAPTKPRRDVPDWWCHRLVGTLIFALTRTAS